MVLVGKLLITRITGMHQIFIVDIPNVALFRSARNIRGLGSCFKVFAILQTLLCRQTSFSIHVRFWCVFSVVILLGAIPPMTPDNPVNFLEVQAQVVGVTRPPVTVVAPDVFLLEVDSVDMFSQLVLRGEAATAMVADKLLFESVLLLVDIQTGIIGGDQQ